MKEATTCIIMETVILNHDLRHEEEIIPFPRPHRGPRPICKTWPNCQELRPHSGGTRVFIRIRA